MRIVAGRFRGRTLHAPRGTETRPTADRVRQAIFNVLAHGVPGARLPGARVLDLFAGTGAMGLEALSRGATFCLFVEENAEARAAIRRNVETMGLTGASRIWRRDATRLGAAGRMAPFDLVFLDPPYGRGLGEAALPGLLDGGWVAPDGIIVLEEHADAAIAVPPAAAIVDRRRWGDTQALFLRPA